MTDQTNEQSLAEMLAEKERLDAQMRILDAMTVIVERTPGASTLEDVERMTGRPWDELLAEETGLTVEVIRDASADI